MNKKYISIIIALGLILCTASSFVGFKIAEGIVSDDLLNLNQRVDDLFAGKDVIQDGHAEVLYGEDSKNGYTIYSGGFTIYKLSKESGGFVKTKLAAGDITWTKGKYEITDYGYSMPTYRPEPKEAYNRAFSYLLTGTEKEPNNSFIREAFTEIKDFPGSFATQYHDIVQSEHPTEFYETRNGGWQFDYDSYKLKYNERKEFFSFTQDKTKVNSLLTIYSAIGIGCGIILTIILSFLLRIIIPNSGKGESIFNKKWKNIESNAILAIEPKLFGKNSVILIEDDKIKRGIAKITDNGDSIHLSFSDSEIFYRLKTLSAQKLEMVNLASNKLIKFELLGSNAHREDNNELLTTENNIEENIL